MSLSLIFYFPFLFLLAFVLCFALLCFAFDGERVETVVMEFLAAGTAARLHSSEGV